MNVRVNGNKVDVSLGSIIMDQLLGYAELGVEVLNYGISPTHQSDHVPEFAEAIDEFSELEFE